MPRGELVPPPRADPEGAVPPVGQTNPTSARKQSKRRKPRPRTCLGKGCDRRFEPRSWNHRYCHDPECRKRVKRWMDRKRQERRRSTEEGKRAHREAEKARRKRLKEEREEREKPRDGAASGRSRGHAAEGQGICDRPGCFLRPKRAVNGQGRYCSHLCRTAVRRVLDRERKWLLRNTKEGRYLREHVYGDIRRGSASSGSTGPGPPPSSL